MATRSKPMPITFQRYSGHDEGRASLQNRELSNDDGDGNKAIVFSHEICKFVTFSLPSQSSFLELPNLMQRPIKAWRIFSDKMHP